MMNRRFRAFVLALVFFFSSIVPVRQANALAPFVMGAVEVTMGSGATLSVFSTAAANTVGYFTAGAAGAIGLIGAYLTIKDAQENAVRIPLGPNSSNEPPVPQAASSVSSQQVTKYRLGASCSGHYGQGSTAAEACANASCSGSTQWFGSSGYTEQWSVSGSCTGTRKVTHDATNAVVSEQAVTLNPSAEFTVSCPAGYSQINSSCLLVNSRLANDDKTCDILISNGQFRTADDLNCPSTVDGSKVAPMIRDGKVIAYGTNSKGQPLMWEVAPAGQSYTVKVSEQIQTSTGTQVQTATMTVDSATSAITSVASSTSPGSIASPASSSVPTSGGSGVATTPTATTTEAQPIVFPADYARQGEAASAANTIKTAVESLKDSPTVDDPELPIPRVIDVKDSFFGEDNRVIGLLGWRVPSHTSACPTAAIDFDWKLVSYHGTLDSHCDIADRIRAQAAVIFDAIWLLAAFFILLGA